MSRNCSILIYTEWHTVWKHLLPHPSIPPSCQKHTRIPFLHALVLFFPLGNLAFLLPSIAVGTWDSTKHILTLSPDRAHPELSKVFKGHERPSWENVLFFSSFSFTPWSIFPHLWRLSSPLEASEAWFGKSRAGLARAGDKSTCAKNRKVWVFHLFSCSCPPPCLRYIKEIKAISNNTNCIFHNFLKLGEELLKKGLITVSINFDLLTTAKYRILIFTI